MFPRMSAFIAMLSLSVIATAGEYVVGTENIGYYPHYNVNENGEYEGFGRDILDRFAADAGHTFVYKPLPVARLMDEHLKGNLDFKYPDNKNWSSGAREGLKIYYSDPIVGFIDGVAAPETIDELNSLSTVNGFTAWAYFDQINSGEIKLHKQSDIAQLIRFVLAGRAQGAYFNIDVLKYHLRESGQQGALKFQEHLPYDASNYHLSTLSHPEVIKEFNQWLSNNSDVVEALKDKYQLSQ